MKAYFSLEAALAVLSRMMNCRITCRGDFRPRSVCTNATMKDTQPHSNVKM
jgi:hypothetical protein